MTAAEKARETRIYRAAREIAARITKLVSPTDEMVFAAMQAQNCSKSVLGDAFWLLDTEPNRFQDHRIWHPRLRRLRNNPEVGGRIFS